MRVYQSDDTFYYTIIWLGFCLVRYLKVKKIYLLISFFYLYYVWLTSKKGDCQGYLSYNITVQQKSPPILIAFAECVFTQKPFYPNSFVCDLIRYPLFFMQVIKS